MHSWKLLLVYAFLVVLSPIALAVPICVQEGTVDEGWRMNDGSVIKAKCSGAVAFCEAEGELAGWHSALTTDSARLVGYANCSEISATKPTCVFVGTDMEGWMTPTGRVLKDKCVGKVAVCSAVGTRSEGWAVVAVDPASVEKIPTSEKCASEDP
jgi:hypothetical protein